MCSIDDAEHFVIEESGHRNARKPHVCSECRRQIEIGETYYWSRGLMSGDGWWKTKQCAHCEVGKDWLTKECGGWCFDMVREEVHEHAEDYRSFGLYRLSVGANRKWQRFDGAGLMPIPKMPPLSSPERKGA